MKNDGMRNISSPGQEQWITDEGNVIARRTSRNKWELAIRGSATKLTAPSRELAFSMARTQEQLRTRRGR